MSKRILALALAAVIALSLVACGGGATKNEAASADPLTKDDIVQVYITSSGSWPYKDDWKVWQYIREGFGGTLDLTVIPLAEQSTKWPILFASPDLLPDIMTDSRTACPYRGADKVAIDINSLVDDYMPNYKAWRDGLDEDKYALYILPNVDTEGKMFSAPTSGFESSGGQHAWLYRKDIFDKHNLKVPTNADELYEVCKQLKALYPNSYPFCMRDLVSKIGIMGPAFDGYWELDYYYDYETETWKHGVLEDTAIETLTFFKKFIDEGLMPPNAVNIAPSEWEELIMSDRGFIFFDFMTRIDNFNSKMSGTDFMVSAFAPFAILDSGSAKTANTAVGSATMFVCNSRNDRRIANAAKYIDWFYTDEACELLSWGKEGETYNVVDGKRVFITDENNNIPKVVFGFQTDGAGLRKDPAASDAFDTAELAAVKPMILETTMPKLNPKNYMCLSADDMKNVIDTNVAINNYKNEMLGKFLLGQASLDNFATFQKDFEALGVNDVLKVYEEAYEKISAN